MRLPLALLALLALPSTAAAAPSLTVRNLAQPGMESTVPQPPVTVEARGRCDHPLTVDEANGAPIACPVGSWPALDESPWGPLVDVADGDVLELRFSAPVKSVATSIVTAFPMGLVIPPPNNPAGAGMAPKPVPNVAALAPQGADATFDAAVWRVTIPQPLDGRAMSGMRFSVAGRAAAGPVNFALMVDTPRWEDESTKCGRVFGWMGGTGYCPSAGIPPGPPLITKAGPPDATPAAPLRLTASRVRVTRKRVRFTVSGSAPGRLRATLSARGRRLGAASATVAGSLALSVRLRRTRAPVATLRLTLTAGGHSVTLVRRVALRA